MVAGGSVDRTFAEKYLRDKKFDQMIAIDGGMVFFQEMGIRPDQIVGDFDSTAKEVVDAYRKQHIPMEQHRPEKDATDTELALELALKQGSDEIHILGGTGTRLDHVLGNIRVLGLALKEKVPCCLVDPTNRIWLVDGTKEISRDSQYGTYVSVLPFTTSIEVSLSGMKYPLEHGKMEGFCALGVSNEIAEEKARICVHDGIAIVVESKDRP